MCASLNLMDPISTGASEDGLPEDGTERAILPPKTQPHKAVPLPKIDRRWRVARLNAHNATVHLGRRSKVVSAHLWATGNIRLYCVTLSRPRQGLFTLIAAELKDRLKCRQRQAIIQSMSRRQGM